MRIIVTRKFYFILKIEASNIDAFYFVAGKQCGIMKLRVGMLCTILTL